MRFIKFKKFQVFNISLYLLICIMCLLSLGITFNANKISNDVLTNIEESYRKETRRILEYFSEQLDDDVDDGLVNVWSDIDLQHWFDRTLMNLRYSGSESFKTAINIGYSFNKPDNETLEKICRGCEIPVEEADELKVAVLNLDLNGKNNIEINREIEDTIKQKIKSDNVFNVINAFKETLFETNKTITSDTNIDVNKLSNLIFRIEKSEAGDNILYQENNKDIWLEWRSVPLSYLGFDKESIDNGHNINYKKIVIIIGVDKEQTISSFSSTFKYINNVIICSNILLIATFLTVALILSYKFIKIIKEDNIHDIQEGDIMR